MHETDLKSWEEFEEKLEYLKENRSLQEASTGHHPSQFLFRGQEDSRWSLRTTLERNGRKGMAFTEFYHLLWRVKSQVETFTGRSFPIEQYPEMERLAANYDPFSLRLDANFPAYEFIVYLRHHGFPSPLLDWTLSPYIAAYFAFRRLVENATKVSIYAFWEKPSGMKVGGSDGAHIHSLGPYVRSHHRHFLQRCSYTICMRWTGAWTFAAHEKVFDEAQKPQGFQQDVLYKFNIPGTERVKVLKLLDAYNLNAFSLFGSEESIMETLALREMEIGDRKPQP